MLPLLSAGCKSPLEHYESALEISNASELPDSKAVAKFEKELDKATSKAGKILRTEKGAAGTALHDATAYVIPLADIARAKLYLRLGQVREAEDAAWKAVENAETQLGRHIRLLQEENGDWDVGALGSSVFFRREKIRRRVFTLLKNAYRQAGEKDLSALMDAQIGFSTDYLCSSVAHGEEEFIRQVENSDWIRTYEEDSARIGYMLKVTLRFLGQIVQVAAAEMQKAQLQQQAAQNPNYSSSYRRQQNAIDRQQELGWEKFKEDLDKMKAKYEATLSNIAATFQKTVATSLSANFELVGFSEEIQALDAFAELEEKKEAFDDYVLRSGFDKQASDALMDMRRSLDDLTRELQERRNS